MSKFCTNCGAQLDDSALFCTTCGSRQEAAAPVAPAAPAYEAPAAPVYETPDVPVYEAPVCDAPVCEAPAAPEPEKKPLNKKTLIGIVAGAAALIAIGLLVFFLFFNSSYTDPIDLYFDAMYKGKLENIEKMAPKEYWDWYEDEYDKTTEDLIEDAEDNYEDYIEELEDTYGENVKATYEITKEKDLSSRKLEKIADALEDNYDIDAKKVTEGKKLDVELTISGDDDDREDAGEITVVKIDGKWYWINWYEYGDEVVVRFNIPG